MNKFIYFVCAFVLASLNVEAQPRMEPRVTIQALDLQNAAKERAFHARQKKTYDKYRRVVDPHSVGKFSKEDTFKCHKEQGIVINRYNREACNLKTLDGDKPCLTNDGCQGKCLAVTTENSKRHGTSLRPTNLQHQPGRCSIHLHIIGCATLSNREEACFSENKPIQK